MPVLLQIARAVVYNPHLPHISMEVQVLFDGGSQWSNLTKHVMEALSIKADGVAAMLIKTIGTDREQKRDCDEVKLGMKMKDGGCLEMSLLAVPLICKPLTAQPTIQALENCEHLEGIELADPSCSDEDLKIDVLIGSDHYWKLVTGGVIRGLKGPTALQTRVGWVLSGPLEELPTVNHSSASLHTTTIHTLKIGVQGGMQNRRDLEQELQRFRDLETLGIKECETNVHEEFERDLEFKDGRYQVRLPWKDNHPILHSNHELSQQRLNGLVRRLKQNPPIAQKYNDVIQEQIRMRMVELVDERQDSAGQITHYLPHHAVIRDDKTTTKLRIVFDASAKANGPSLNECLYAGPKFNQNILDIILRFRMYKIALIADIEKAFLMIQVAEPDRDMVRFLWVDYNESENPNTVALQFAHFVFGVTSSSFFVECHYKEASHEIQ